MKKERIRPLLVFELVINGRLDWYPFFFVCPSASNKERKKKELTKDHATFYMCNSLYSCSLV